MSSRSRPPRSGTRICSSAPRSASPRSVRTRRRSTPCSSASMASSRRTSTASSCPCTTSSSTYEEGDPPQPARRRSRPRGALAARSDRGPRQAPALRDDHRRGDAARLEVGARLLLDPRHGGRPRRRRGGPAAGRWIPAPRGRAALRPPLRAGAPLLRRSLARARRARRGAARPGSASEEGRRVSASPSVQRGVLFLIDKPGGLTSHDVVERVRKTTGEKRVGHSGTLDPMATGLLLLCAGGAARLQAFFTKLDKSYEGTIRLGRATTTYDREGEAVGPDRDASAVTRDAIEQASSAFRGEFLQSPPPYSA